MEPSVKIDAVELEEGDIVELSLVQSQSSLGGGGD